MKEMKEADGILNHELWKFNAVIFTAQLLVFVFIAIMGVLVSPWEVLLFTIGSILAIAVSFFGSAIAHYNRAWSIKRWFAGMGMGFSFMLMYFSFKGMIVLEALNHVH